MADLADDLEKMIELAIKKLAAERSRYAVEPNSIFDYIDFGSTRLYRPTLAHLWYLLSLDEVFAFETKREHFLNSIYALIFSADEVRNKLFRQMKLDAKKVSADAESFFAAHEDIMAAGALLMDDLKGDESAEEQSDSSLELGWYANILGVLAATYSWTEKEIFSIPIIRLRSYLKNINCASRTFPLLPAEKELKKLMELKLEIMKHGHEKD